MFSSFRSREPRPVFVIGSYRSATSALTWALGQHSNIFPLEETHFLYKLSVDLEYLYRIGSAQAEHSFLGLAGYAPREFREHFGRAIHGMVSDAKKRIASNSLRAALRDTSRVSDNIKLARGRFQPKRRWVDGTPENSHYVLPLLRMFPHARFIHILRNPKRVATSLMHFSTMGAFDYAEEEAYRTWYRLVRDSALAEQALGPGMVMRLDHEELIASPESALRKCLKFVGENYQQNCLMPLREKLNSSQYGDPGDCTIENNICSPKPWIREAFQLYEKLIQGQPLAPGGKAGACRLMKSTLTDYARSIEPATNEQLSSENGVLRKQVETLRNHVKRLETPMELLDWGPRHVNAGAPFNPQENGNNAIWTRTRHASYDTVIYLNDVPLNTSVHPDGELVTAEVPPLLTAQAGRAKLILRSVSSDECTPAAEFVIRHD